MNWLTNKMRKFLTLMLTGLAASWTISACSPQLAETESVNLTLVSYAVTQKAYEEIIPKFTDFWQEKTGQSVTFDQSYGGSGSQTRAVIDGLEADIVALALALDVNKIEKAGLINEGWEQEVPNEAIAHRSVAALVTRDDTIKINQWSDLAGDNIKVITANPKTSGGARWNFLALWGSITQSGGTEAQATEFVAKVLNNAPVLPKDAREASDVFYKQGQGNVLMNYENEIILAEQQGYKSTYIIPTDYNISIDNPVAVVDANVDKHGTREVAEAFVQFLFTPEAQTEFAKAGFRPVNTEVMKQFQAQYPEVKNLFTVKDLGGWNEIQSKFFDDGAVFDKMMSQK
ncbi:sulfate ABC transporter substrate-binding protein [Gloeocapsa sp. PCC 73106]|uniref:sulfate ABC transporter substrate-binding protein n=1 Tax=Gloeocapsa sp. PCC 73106 TaxID=102232 RepID=UPI0002ABAF20|nr:sulfate ABC transporter substrate-binding protein [Gloeocapsa sp. PCC 73106]ELR99169.1 sulfate/thiosulfate-binding protein [Gloeocapsa sp. PCC 73106]